MTKPNPGPLPLGRMRPDPAALAFDLETTLFDRFSGREP